MRLTGREGEQLPSLFASHGRKPSTWVPVRTETVSELVTSISATMVESKTARAPFELRDLRRTYETMPAAMGISKDLRAQIQRHGLGGVQDRHYDRHEYMDEKRNALEAWAERLRQIETGKAGKGGKVTQIRGTRMA